MTNQAARLKTNKIKGPVKNKTIEALLGIGFSLRINFNASAIGCNKPKNPVQFGPFRFWILANTLRSNKVKNATTGIIFNNK